MLTQNKLRTIFGLKIAYLRQQKGLSYQQLADLAELSISYVHEIEKGKKYPKAEKILTLAKVLDTTYDELVSVHASKKLQPIIDLLESEFFQVFPMEMFGINPEKVLELFVNAPDRLNAFISTIIKIARNYQMQNENVYTAALRTYQDMNDNYFEDIEKAVADMKEAHKIHISASYTTSYLEQLLQTICGIKINRKLMKEDKALRNIRSFYTEGSKTLHINKGLSVGQENFLIAREFGFQFLGLTERSYETVIQKADSFEVLFNNFKASYFASAFLLNEQDIVADINHIAQQLECTPALFEALIEKYNVTSEMLIQRLTNILPKHFKINNLFFIRLKSDETMKNFTMNKELHLSRLHQAYANELNEHYCRRWLSINTIKQLRTTQQLDKTIKQVWDTQISTYWETELSYFCLTVAKPNTSNPKETTSVTLGLMLDDNVKRLFKFLSDPKLKTKMVNTTCERCSMPDCSERAVPPFFIEKKNEQIEMEKALKNLG
jgi:XRE family transcriptional regulator, fatty acid utilization regulator